MHHRLLLRPPLPDGSPALSPDVQLTHIGFADIRARVNGEGDVVARNNEI